SSLPTTSRPSCSAEAATGSPSKLPESCWRRSPSSSCRTGTERPWRLPRPSPRGGSAMAAGQEAPGLWRTDLQPHDLSAPGREVVQNRVEIGPEAPAFRHRHPGEEVIYVLEGSLEYHIDGETPVTVEAGAVFFVPAGAIHTVKNVGAGHAIELATYVVD